MWSRHYFWVPLRLRPVPRVSFVPEVCPALLQPETESAPSPPEEDAGARRGCSDRGAEAAACARSIQLHMQLLAHAAICRNPKCPSANCEKMKVCGVLWFNSISTIVATQLTSMISFCTRRAVYRTFSRMVRNVKPKVQGRCNVCRRIWALLQIHARQLPKAELPSAEMPATEGAASGD